jgi:hypothetical protein
VAGFFGQRRNATPYKLSPSSSPPPYFVISPDMRNQTLGSTTIDDHNKEGRKVGGINPSSVMLFGWVPTYLPFFVGFPVLLVSPKSPPQQRNTICTFVISQFSFQWSKSY